MMQREGWELGMRPRWASHRQHRSRNCSPRCNWTGTTGTPRRKPRKRRTDNRYSTARYTRRYGCLDRRPGTDCFRCCTPAPPPSGRKIRRRLAPLSLPGWSRTPLSTSRCFLVGRSTHGLPPLLWGKDRSPSVPPSTEVVLWAKGWVEVMAGRWLSPLRWLLGVATVEVMTLPQQQ